MKKYTKEDLTPGFIYGFTTGIDEIAIVIKQLNDYDDNSLFEVWYQFRDGTEIAEVTAGVIISDLNNGDTYEL